MSACENKLHTLHAFNSLYRSHTLDRSYSPSEEKVGKHSKPYLYKGRFLQFGLCVFAQMKKRMHVRNAGAAAAP